MSSRDKEFDIVSTKIRSLISNLESTGINIQTKFIKESGNIIINVSDFNSEFTNAKLAINEILELSYSIAEHHPYWNILYNTCEILNLTLEKWNNILNESDLQDLEWRANEIKYALKKLK
ncbi:MAG: hypothetical protein ACPKQO_02385 [Nitrososphaeraceae archaeon]